MTFGLKTALVAGLALGGLGFAGAALALPAQGLNKALATSANAAMPVWDVRWICPPYRPCFFAPGYGYGYGYRPYYRSYGFYRPYGYYRPFGFRHFY